MTEENTTKPAKSRRGGPRPNSGRPAGSKNIRTIQKEQRLKREVETALAVASSEEIDQMSAVQVMDIAMKTFMKAGNLERAVHVAERLAPFQSAKIASQVYDVPLPEDMLPMPTPTPDEPCPPLIE
jgi:hypothetical protein